jgi:hypothetical protein
MPRLRPAFGSTVGVAPTSAADFARHLGGKKSGARSWSCRCPAHNDSNPSLSVTEGDGGKILFYCHAGCSQNAVIDALRNRALLWRGSGESATPELARIVKQWRERDPDTAALAKRIWAEGVDPAGTVAEEYLAARQTYSCAGIARLCSEVSLGVRMGRRDGSGVNRRIPLHCRRQYADRNSSHPTRSTGTMA